MDLEEDGSSSCCGAKVYLGICHDCQEHCDLVKPEHDEELGDDPHVELDRELKKSVDWPL